MLKEFQEFISKGNVMDLAVGVIIGAAFGKIVTSLVDDVIMPFIGALGGVDFNNYFIGLSHNVTATNLEDARKQGAVFAYGSFITVALNFLIIAFVIFLMVKAVNNLRRRLEREKPAAPAAPPPADVALLTESAICSPNDNSADHCWTKTPVVRGWGFLFSYLVKSGKPRAIPGKV